MCSNMLIKAISSIGYVSIVSLACYFTFYIYYNVCINAFVFSRKWDAAFNQFWSIRNSWSLTTYVFLPSCHVWSNSIHSKKFLFQMDILSQKQNYLLISLYAVFTCVPYFHGEFRIWVVYVRAFVLWQFQGSSSQQL